MELELGLKITRTREDVSSSVDFRFSKDPFGPLVLSQETNSRFIIIIHLKGFKKEGIEIDINKEGDRITISGRKPVEEMVMVRWMAWRKQVEFRVFKKVFRIPDIVDLDKIKARFDDDDATLTITMPKRVKGISGFKIEEEEEERVDFGDVSEAEHKEETEKGDVDEESIEREEIDENFEKLETEIQREEELGETMQTKERESQVLGEEQKGSSGGGLDEEEIEDDDDNLEKIQQIDEQDKIMERIEEEEEDEELADSNKESEDSSLRKPPDIEGRESLEQTRDEEQENSQQLVQAESKSDDFGSRAFEEIEEQEPDVLNKTSKSRTTEKEMADDDGDGLRQVQGTEEPERDNEKSQIQEMVEGETGGHEKKKTVKMEIRNKDAKDEVDGKMGEGFRPNIDRTQVVGGNDIAEPEIKAEEFESDKIEADEVDKIYELVEKKEEEGENAKVGTQSEDRSLIKLQETEEQHSKGKKRHSKQEKIKQLVEEKSPAAETNIGNDIPKPVQEIQVPKVDTVAKTGDEGKEGKETGKSAKMEIKNGDAKEEVDMKTNIPETATKTEEFESDKLDSDEVDKIQKLVEKKEEEEKNAKVGTQSEDVSLVKLQELGEERFQGQKRHDKQGKIKELVKEQTPEAEVNIGNNIPKPVQEIEEVQEVETLGKTGDEGKAEKKKQNIVKQEIKNRDSKEEIDAKMGEVFASNIADTAMKSEDFESDHKIESDEEVDKIQKLVEKKDKEEENAKVGAQSEDPSLTKLQEEIGEQPFQGQKRLDKQEEIKELVEEQTPDAETNIRNDIPKPVQERCEGKHKIQKLFQEETKNQPEEYKENIMETGKNISDAAARKVQEIIRQHELDEPARSGKESKTRELVKSKRNDEEKEEKEIAETETKEQESNRPKILREQEKTHELAEEKTNFSKNGKVKEEDEIAEKKPEYGGDDDDISRKVRDVEQRDSEAMKGQEEKDMNHELVQEETVSDGGKGIIPEVETKTENDKSKRVQEIDEQQSHEEDTCGKQEKLIGGEISGCGEVEDVKNKKKTTETENRIQDRTSEAQEIENTDSDVSEKYIKGTMIQENEENRRIDRNEHEEEKKDEADRPEKVTGMIEQELVNLNSKLEQENVEDGKKTQELVEEEIKDSEKAKTKTDDDVVRKLQGIKEQELYEPKEEHASKVKELVEEKTGDHDKQKEKKIADSEIEAESGSLKKVHGIEEQELHETKIQKECDKTRITGTEEPSGQEEEKIVESMTIVGGKNCNEEQELHEPKVHKEHIKTRAKEPSGEEEEKIVDPMTITENDNSVDVQEIKKKGPDKPESYEKRYKIQEVVEERDIDRKEEKVLETEAEKSKKVQEIGQEEYDGQNRSMVQDKMQETGEKQKTSAMEEKKIVERKTKTKDGSLSNVQDDEDPESTKPYKGQKKDKIQELVEMGTSDYGEKDKKQDENDILRSQEDLDEFERHGEQSNVPQMVEEEKVENISELEGKLEDDDCSGKFHDFEEGKSYEDRTHEEHEKRKDFKKEEPTDPKDKHTSGEGHNDHKKEEQEEQEEKVIAKTELKTKEDSSKKVREIEKQEYDELKRSTAQNKMQKTEEKDKNRLMEENEIVDRRKKTKDDSLRKVQLGKQKRHGEEDRIQDLVETEINDHRGKVKKKDGDDILRSQETGKLDLGERERHSKRRKIYQSVEDEKEGKMENNSEPGGKSEEIENVVEEVIEPKDKHTGGGGGGEHEEEERYEKVALTKTKIENEINKKIIENKEPESDKQERYMILDKLAGVLREEASDRKKEDIIVDDFTTEIPKIEKEESHELEMHEKLDIIQDFMEDERGDQEDEEAADAAAVVTSNENEISRKIQTIKEESQDDMAQNKIPETSDPEVEDTKEEVPNSRNVRETKELEAHVQELEAKTENCKDEDGEGSRGEKGKQGKIVETMSRERFKIKSDDGIVRNIQDTKVQESNEKKNQERKGNIEEPESKESSSLEEKLAVEDDSLRKGQEFLEKESNVSKRRPVKQEKFQELKMVDKQDRVDEDEEKAEPETKIDDGNSRMFEMSKLLELDESDEHKKIQKPMEEKSNAPEIEKEGNEKIAEEELHDKVDGRVKDQEIKGQEPYEFLKDGEHDKIPQYHREDEKGIEQREIEEMKRIAEDVSSRNVQQIKDELEKHQKPSEIPKKHNIQESMASIKSQDVEEIGSDQPNRHAEQEKIQELMTDEDGREEYHIREGEQNKKAKRIPQVESNTEGHESTGLRGGKEKDNHQELMETETSDQRKEEKEEVVARKEENIDEFEDGSSRKIDELEERKSDQMSEKLAEEETSDDKEVKEGNRAGAVLGEVEKVREIEEHEQDKKQSFVDTSGKAKEKTKSRNDSAGSKTQKQESYKKKSHDEQEKKNLGLVGEKTNCFRNEEDGKDNKYIAEAELPRKLKGIEKRESTKMVIKNENRDDIKELVEENMKNQEEEDKKSMITEVLEKSEDDESKRPEGLRKQDKSREHTLRDNHKDEGNAKTETKGKDNESRKTHQIKEQERLKEQGRIKELVEDRTHYRREKENRETEFEDGSSKKIQERDKEESNKPERDEKGDKIQEPVDKETSEDDEEELEIEFEDEEEDWEAEVIQETDSDEDKDNIRQIKRIRLGFRLVGGSTFFMSLIVIVISFIRSKRKIRCYKF